jgi:hypothetical protein
VSRPLPARHLLHDARETLYRAVDHAAEADDPLFATDGRCITWPVADRAAVEILVGALSWDRGARPAVQRKAAAGMEQYVAGGAIRGVTLVLSSPMVRCKAEEVSCAECEASTRSGAGLLCDEHDRSGR